MLVYRITMFVTAVRSFPGSSGGRGGSAGGTVSRVSGPTAKRLRRERRSPRAHTRRLSTALTRDGSPVRRRACGGGGVAASRIGHLHDRRLQIDSMLTGDPWFETDRPCSDR